LRSVMFWDMNMPAMISPRSFFTGSVWTI